MALSDLLNQMHGGGVHHHVVIPSRGRESLLKFLVMSIGKTAMSKPDKSQISKELAFQCWMGGQKIIKKNVGEC